MLGLELGAQFNCGNVATFFVLSAEVTASELRALRGAQSWFKRPVPKQQERLVPFAVAAVAFLVLVELAWGHSSFLKDCPGLTNPYFGNWGSGAVGHNGGRSGASLNPFGEAFKRGWADKMMQSDCAVTDEDDDDDDDDDHHGNWGILLCCADSDKDGLTNGAELGDPCCEWKKGRPLPWSSYQVSHPGMYTEQTTDRRACNGTFMHRKPMCSPYPPSPGPLPPAPTPTPTPTPTPSAPTPAPTANECQPSQTCTVCDACCKSYIQDGSECDACVKAECAAPVPTPPPRPVTCEACLEAKMVWCYTDEKCWAHNDPGDQKPGTCPGYSHCASDIGCTCTSCADRRCQSTARAATTDQLYAQGYNARTVLEQTGAWQLTTNLTSADLIWVRNRCILGKYAGRPGQAVNRLDYDRIVASKAKLARLMASLPSQAKDFFPETLQLVTHTDAAVVNRTLADAGSAVWILKAADMSKGKGIIPIPAPREWVLAGGAQQAIDSGRAHVVQKYIERPYLLDGFKSEVRLYFLVASVVPLKLLWYTEGSVRLAAQRFEAGQWDNPLVHIVNTAQGKRVLGKQRYAKFVADSPRKWSFAKMASHLQKNVTAGRNPWQHILSQMKRAIGIVLRAAAPHMQRPRRNVRRSGTHLPSWLRISYWTQT